MPVKNPMQRQVNLIKARAAIKTGDVVALLDALLALSPDLGSIKGRNGVTPVKGTDYFTPAEIMAIKEDIANDIVTPKNGQPGARGPKGDSIQGAQGTPGKEGPAGYTPVAGVDYYTDKEKWSFIDRVKEGAIGVLTTMCRALIEKLVDEKIGSVPRVIERRQMPQISFMARTGSKTMEVWSGTTPIGQDIRKIIFEGSALSVARVSDGVAVVTGTGGSGSGANVSTEKLTPTASGNNITLDLTALAHTFATIQWISKNGQILDPADATFGWSRSSNTVTVLNAANTDIFLVSYTYA